MPVKKRPTKRAPVVNREPYGDPIWRAIADGDVARMQQLETTTEQWIADRSTKLAEVKKALGALRRAKKKLS